MSRAELIQICKELKIYEEGLTIEEMTEKIRDTTSYRFKKRKYPLSINKLSNTLVKFLTEEYDFILKDKEGNVKSFYDLERFKNEV